MFWMMMGHSRDDPGENLQLYLCLILPYHAIPLDLTKFCLNPVYLKNGIFITFSLSIDEKSCILKLRDFFLCDLLSYTCH